MRCILLFILFATGSYCSQAQSLSGVWSGIISRAASSYSGVESLELYLFQYGNKLEGYSYAYKDNRRFVLYNIKGRRNKKEKLIVLQEFGTPAYDIPESFFPCEKKLVLRYKKIGKTQYLVGNWGGTGFGLDTTCFPGEDLLVVLQKIQKPELPATQYVISKLVRYFEKRRLDANTDSLADVNPVDSLAPPEEPGVKINPLAIPQLTLSERKDSLPEDRKLEIQQVIRVKDSVFTVRFYDNAIIDDDTISVFVNKRLMFTRQRISTKPLEFSLTLPQPGQTVEILMQAENLGTIPPNTALAVIETTRRRYEARLSAGLDKSAVIVITYEPD